MQNDTSNTIDSAKLESEVRDTVAQGDNVQESVQRLTLKALSSEIHDLASLRRVITAVMRGARDGVQQKLQQTNAAKIQMTDAIAGLDAALAQLAEASKLAVEEAASRARKFSNEELTRARSDLESLEVLFLETLQSSASATKGLVADTLHDLVTHAKLNGTAVSSQLQDTLTAFTQQMTSTGQSQLESGVKLTHATSDLLRKVAAGVLGGTAERVKPGEKHQNS
jgi:F0F1-type ATP synthase membrane subunit b/b'